MLPLLLAMFQAAPLTDFQNRVAEIEKATIPDKRLEFLQVEAVKQGDKWEVKGDTTVAAARDGILEAARAVFGNRLGKVELRVLPDSSLGEKTEALIRVSVAPMRRTPRHSAEMVDQVVMGTPVRPLKEEGSWLLIQTPYRYLGWVEKLMVTRLTQAELSAWTTGPLARYSRPSGTVWAHFDETEPVCDIVLSCVVRPGPMQGGLTAVILPDGRKGFLPPDSLSPFTVAGHHKPNPADVVRLALQLRGIPYLWGGNSTKGFDCSGFTQTVFGMNGVALPRDADQQAALGTKVESSADFSNVKAGDLLFFGKDRITHVAISLGGARFIHASGDVHIKSLAPHDKDFDSERRDNLQFIKRVLTEP